MAFSDTIRDAAIRATEDRAGTDTGASTLSMTEHMIWNAIVDETKFRVWDEAWSHTLWEAPNAAIRNAIGLL